MNRNRGLKLLNLARLEMLSSVPRYESTKSSTKEEREIAIRRENMLFSKRSVYENSMECDSTTIKTPEEIPKEILTSLSQCSAEKLNDTQHVVITDFETPAMHATKIKNSAEASDLLDSPIAQSTTSAARAHNRNQNPQNEAMDSSFSEDKTSGSEYLPTDSESQSDADDCISYKSHVTGDFEPKKGSQKPLIKVQPETVEADSTSAEIPNKKRKGQCKSNCTVTAARKNDDGKRIRNKRHACYFCNKEIINMARHLDINHKNETEVAKILTIEKNSKKRKEAFAELTRIGDFNHNCEVLSSGEGELILVRRPTLNELKLVTYKDYGPCPHCLGFMLKKHIWHHVKTGCSKKRNEDANNGEDEKNSRHVIAESNAILSNVFNSELSADYKKYILDALRNDDVGNYCKDDQLLVKFGGMQFEKYGLTQNDLIKQRMRQLSRLTLKLRESSVGNVGLADFLAPDKFDVLIQAVKTLCGSSANDATKRPEFAVPSLALKIGHSLKKCANIQRGTALRNSDIQKNEKLTNFISLMEMEWPIRISSNALTTLAHRKLNVPQLLPITDDLKKLKDHIDLEMDKAMTDVIATPHVNHWHRLSILTLSRMILFNKKRAGEASRMTIEQYCSQPSWSEQCTHELKDSLSAYEKKLAERLCVVHIVGKRGRKVPVILTSPIKSAIDILLKYRKECGILENNPYVFARANQSLTNIHGHDSLRKIVSEINLQKPSYITGTKLREYVATVCQIFDLNENEYDWLARHLGHDIRVHREFYRLHEDAVELTKVSRLLLAVDAGEASRFAGKKLSDIELKDLLAIEEDEGMEEEEEETGTPAPDTPSNKRRQKSKAGVKQKKPRSSVKTGEPLVCLGEEFNKLNEIVTSQFDRPTKKMWSDEEKAAVAQFFKINMKNGIIPKKKDCEEIQRRHPILGQRKWSDIKFFVSNQIKKANKNK